MNTLRVSGPLDVGRGPMGMLVRTIALSTLLCAAVFAGAFALGRSQRSPVATGERIAPSLPASAAGPAIPLRLSSVPTLVAPAPVVNRTAARSPASVRVIRAVVTPSTPIVSSAPTEAQATPSAPATHASPKQPSSAVGSAPASGGSSSHGSGGAAKTETSGSTSFDSSG